IHSNGYSLVRQLIKKPGINLNDSFGDSTYLETFLAPTQLYVKPILELKKHVSIKAMNHITGGGFYENIPRSLPEGLAADIDSHAFPT
ncbi:AIR synthase-related protein, partial [Staphylococcus epidermidis]|uniref:AIR synthase-related protein n=2 Tax=Staphylococcus TaxID=1279 RepID=UPI0030C29BB0